MPIPTCAAHTAHTLRNLAAPYASSVLHSAEQHTLARYRISHRSIHSAGTARRAAHTLSQYRTAHSDGVAR
eukprot:3900686-Rhodomonas_salina.1